MPVVINDFEVLVEPPAPTPAGGRPTTEPTPPRAAPRPENLETQARREQRRRRRLAAE